MKPGILLCLVLAGCSYSSDVARPVLDMGLNFQTETEKKDPAFRGPGVGIEKPSGETKISEEDIQLALQAAGPLDGPVRVAVVEIVPGFPGYRPTSVAPEHLDAFRSALGGTADSVQAVPQMFLPQNADLPALRYAAARIGANSLFVFGRGRNTGTYFNNWSHLNWLILPVFVVPGKTVEVYATAEGALVDVASSRVRAVASADLRLDSDITTASSSRRPLAELEREASLGSLKELGANLGKEVGALKVGQK
ncbi:MAG: hypothetical protein HYY18_01810 [Planctomycetes bacterium]|nr:hypothetical protein [Planctomycetota bacterium]